MRRNIRTIAAAAVLLLAVAAFPQTLPPGVQKVTSVEGITEYSLPNGLHILLFPDDSKPKVTVNITYMVGSRYEGYGETGMAHLLEHMNFIQTTTRTNIKKELTDHGAEMNGTTDYDRTNYYETLNATDENLRWALGLEADRMVNTRIEKPLLDTEMTVVRNEFEMGENDPGSILYERMLETAYLWHAYGHPTIGNRADIENVPIQKLAAFYQKYYQPDNALLTVAGKFDSAKALAWIAELFGKIPRPQRTIEQPYTVEPEQDGERSVTLRRVGDTQYVMAMYHMPAALHPDDAAIQVLCGVLGDVPSGRLYKALVDNKKAVARPWIHGRHRAVEPRSKPGRSPADSDQDRRGFCQGAPQQGRSRSRENADPKVHRAFDGRYHAHRTAAHRVRVARRLAHAVSGARSSGGRHPARRRTRG
jgi:zinc protease